VCGQWLLSVLKLILILVLCRYCVSMTDINVYLFIHCCPDWLFIDIYCHSMTHSLFYSGLHSFSFHLLKYIIYSIHIASRWKWLFNDLLLLWPYWYVVLTIQWLLIIIQSVTILLTGIVIDIDYWNDDWYSAIQWLLMINVQYSILWYHCWEYCC